MNTRTSVISERKVWFQQARVWFIYVGCDFHTQSVISIRRVWLQHAECDFYTQSVIATRRVWFVHAKCNFQTQCDFDMHKCDCDTYHSCYHFRECHNHTHTSQHHTLRVELTVVSVVITFVRVKITQRLDITLCLKQSHAACGNHTTYINHTRACWNHTLLSEITLVRVFITVYVWTSHKRVISTRRVWCWHAWVWLWHSRKWLRHLYVSKPYSACGNHSFVWCSHAYWDEHTHECNFWTQSVISTRPSVIYIRRVWFIYVECDFHAQSLISQHRV
jgi:hypothetical protein